MPDFVSLISRWVHILSAVTLVGGFLYARLILIPAARVLAPEAQDALGEAAARRFRPLAYLAVAGLLLSGAYNYMSKAGAPPVYHAVIGFKLLLALHVFAVAFLSLQPRNARRARLMTGLIASALLIVVLSGYLRWITLHP